MTAAAPSVTYLFAVLAQDGRLDCRVRRRVAEAAGLSPLSVGEFAYGEDAPGAEERCRLAEHLGFAEDDLFAAPGTATNPRLAKAHTRAVVAIIRRRRRGTTDMADYAFWPDAYVQSVDRAAPMVGFREHGNARATGSPSRPRGAGRPAARRRVKVSASSSDDPEPEPPRFQPGRRPRDLATRGKGRLICARCGSKYRADAGTVELCGPCERRLQRKAERRT